MAVWLAVAPGVANADGAPDSDPAVVVPDYDPSGPGATPGRADSIEIGRNRSERTWLWIPRAALALPRQAFSFFTRPITWLLWLEDEYALRYRYVDLFFNDARTFGVYPTAFFETGFGLNVGLRLVHRDLFGHGESLRLRAGFGGTRRQVYAARVATGGSEPGDTRMWMRIRFERDPKDRFFGIGNADRVDVAEVAGPVDPFGSAAVKTIFRSDEAGMSIGITHTQSSRLRAQIRQVWRWRRFTTGRPRDGGRPWTDQVYASERLVGFDDPFFGMYMELRLKWRSWRSAHRELPAGLPSTGWGLTAWGGWQMEDFASFGRLGLDVQRYFDLFRGNRVLRMRLRVATVLGPRGHIPFADYAQLGGSLLLRGYHEGRFRGRLTALGGVEYRYPLQINSSAFLFVDAGRAYVDIDGLTYEGVRVGFGGGVLVFTRSRFLMRVQIASSVEGGVFVRAGFEPTHSFGETP